MKTTRDVQKQIDNEEQSIAQASKNNERFELERAEALAEGAYEDAERLEQEVARTKADMRRRRERIELLGAKWQEAQAREIEQSLDTQRAKAMQAAEIQKQLMASYREQARPLVDLLRKLAAIDAYIRQVNGGLTEGRIPNRDERLRGKPSKRESDRTETREEWQLHDGSPVSTFRKDESGRMVPMESNARLVDVEYVVPGNYSPAVVPRPLYETVKLPAYLYNEPALWDAESLRDATRRTADVLAELGIDDSREAA